MKNFSILLAVLLAACGGGVEEPKPEPVAIKTESLPSPFVIGPSGQVPVPTNTPVPFVIGPVTGTPVTPVPPVIINNYCKPDSNGFVIGPCVPQEQPKINYCTNGFVVGPCTPLPSTCKPDSNGFVIGPCTP